MTAHNEFLCMSSAANGGQNLIQRRTAVVEGIALEAADLAILAAAGAKLVWSPRSNLALYGDSALVTVAARLGIPIALGTDWAVTGSMNLLRELKCADTLNADYYDHFFSDEDLWRMVTGTAAAAAGFDDVLGALAPGKVADIAIFDGSIHPGFRAVIDAGVQDVVLVIRGGKALYGDASVVSALADGCDAIDVCGAAKLVCVMTEVGKTYAALQTAVGTGYPAFFCGTPTNEPTCTPQRPVSVNGSSASTAVHASTATQTVMAWPMAPTTVPASSIPCVPKTTASRPTPTETASATRAIPARSRATRWSAQRHLPTAVGHSRVLASGEESTSRRELGS